MKKYKYIIIGGGMAGGSAAEGIREIDSKGEIGLFSKETNPPYNRPPLSKGLWQAEAPNREDIWRGTDSIVDLELYLDTEIIDIDREKRLVYDDNANVFQYEKLLLATGGTPKTLPFDPDGQNVLYFRTLEDFNKLSKNLGQRRTIGVIGGGFIGAEIAASLRINNQEVVMFFPEKAIGSRRYPETLSELITETYKKKGVKVYAEEMVIDVTPTQGKFAVATESGKRVIVDQVVAGVGINPNLELAKRIGLETGDGIIVDKTLRTSDVHIWAAGDVASFYSPHLQERVRIEHAENAKKMGKTAGRNMAGANEPYNILPLFYSDMFDMGFEAVGELDPDLNVIIDWKKRPEKAVAYYLDEDEGSVRGVILWNVWGEVDKARELIASEEKITPVDLINYI